MRLRTASGSAFQDPPDYGPSGKERTTSRHLDRRVPHRRTATALRLFRVGRASGITRFADRFVDYSEVPPPIKTGTTLTPVHGSSIMVSASGNTARLRFLAASLPAPGTAAVSTRMSDAPALVRERQRSLLAEHASPADRASADTSELPTAALPAERSNHGRESRVPGRPQTRKPARAPRRLSLRGRQVGAGSDEQTNPNQDTPKGSDGAWRHARRGQATDPDHGARRRPGYQRLRSLTVVLGPRAATVNRRGRGQSPLKSGNVA